MVWRSCKYALPFIVFVGAVFSFAGSGFIVWLPVVYAFAMIPLLELFIAPENHSMEHAEEEIALQNRTYDWFLYVIVPLQYIMLYLFLKGVSDNDLSISDRAGRILTMGLLCGIFGINVGHELGHRVKAHERLLAKCLLLTSIYMHFYIEHNRGHHKHVGTPADPNTAPFNQSLYAFWFRSISGVYANAWRIATAEQRKHGSKWFQNEMFRYQLIELCFCIMIGFVFGWQALLFFLLAAAVGILLLETVNYIEHYGLARKQVGNGKFERALPEHSWNSSHIIGRLMLFELSRHSDHHYLASRKYQVLRHHENAPQLPTGYPGSMILAMIPPLWFRIMNRRIRKYRQSDIIH